MDDLGVSPDDGAGGPAACGSEIVDDVALSWLSGAEVGMADDGARHVVAHGTGHEAVDDQNTGSFGPVLAWKDTDILGIPFEDEVVDRVGIDTDHGTDRGWMDPLSAVVNRVPEREATGIVQRRVVIGSKIGVFETDNVSVGNQCLDDLGDHVAGRVDVSWSDLVTALLGTVGHLHATGAEETGTDGRMDRRHGGDSIRRSIRRTG